MATKQKDTEIVLAEHDVDVSDIKVDKAPLFKGKKTETKEEEELEKYVYKILKRAAALQGVKIERDVFLRTELGKYCPSKMVDKAVKTTPALAGVPDDIVDKVANASIRLESKKVSGLSFLAGLPGGLALFGTIPADLIQYFAHVLRIEQKLAYIYGWESFLDDDDEIDDETMFELILFLGVMMQVGGAATTLTKFAIDVAAKGVAKTIQKKALTKTVYYPVIKGVLRVLGVQLTKETFAKTVSKAVPVIGGVISGGLTYATFVPGAKRLKKYLRVLPQAKGGVVDITIVASAVAEDTPVSDVSCGDFLGILDGKEDSYPVSSKYAAEHPMPAEQGGNLRESVVEWFARGEASDSARPSYQRLQRPASLIWIAEAVGVDAVVTEGAYDAAVAAGGRQQACGAIRKMIPWQVICEAAFIDSAK